MKKLKIFKDRRKTSKIKEKGRGIQAGGTKKGKVGANVDQNIKGKE